VEHIKLNYILYENVFFVQDIVFFFLQLSELEFKVSSYIFEY